MVRGEAALTRRKAPRRIFFFFLLAAFFCFNAASLSIRKKILWNPGYLTTQSNFYISARNEQVKKTIVALKPILGKILLDKD